MQTVNLDHCAILGVDVGFSARRATTGIAWVVDGEVEAVRTHSDWPRRRLELPTSQSFDMIAIDGPLLPDGADPETDRLCERVFLRRPFHNRCKPGLSHFGTGRHLRRAAVETADQFRSLIKPGAATCFGGPFVIGNVPIIEAFPNAFLGLLLSGDAFAERPKPRKRFDWLYDKALSEGVFPRLLDFLDWRGPGLLQRLSNEHDHERRAALICLLTAATAAVGKGTTVGNDVGGYLWMPPRELWSDWASAGMDSSGQIA